MRKHRREVFDRANGASSKQGLNCDIESRFFLYLSHGGVVRLLVRVDNSGDWGPFTIIGATNQQDLGQGVHRCIRRNIANDDSRDTGEPERSVAHFFTELNNEIRNCHSCELI